MAPPWMAECRFTSSVRWRGVKMPLLMSEETFQMFRKGRRSGKAIQTSWPSLKSVRVGNANGYAAAPRRILISLSIGDAEELKTANSMQLSSDAISATVKYVSNKLKSVFRYVKQRAASKNLAKPGGLSLLPELASGGPQHARGWQILNGSTTPVPCPENALDSIHAIETC